MNRIRHIILQLLNRHVNNEAVFVKKIESLAKKEGDEVFRVFLNILTNFNFSAQESKDHWKSILSHKKKIGESLARTVSLMTAICDYFSTVKKIFHNPMMVEIKAFEETAESSNRDGLTNLFNRRYLDEALANELSRAKRYEEEFSLVFFDLDDFKSLNDSLGHMAGDMALKNVARIITGQKRAEDIAARYGGEEILLMLPKTSKSHARVIAERIRKHVEMMSMEYEGEPFQIALSGGVASFPDDAEEAKFLVQRADKAMYMAKKTGKNKIVLYSPDRRTHLRVEFLEEIKVIHGNNSTLDLKCKVKNMSSSGILFETKEALKTGTEVQVQLPKVAKRRPVKIAGKVARVTAFESSYDTGVAFLAMSEKEKNKISDALAKYLDLAVEE